MTKANLNMANPMQNKWVCDKCYTHEPDLSWEPLQLREFREMQATFMLPQPMLLAMARAGMTAVKPAVCSRVSVQLATVSPGAVVPGAEGLHNLLPYTGQHVASLCSQAVPDQQHSKLGLDVLFLCACVQYHCVKCAHSVDVVHNFSSPPHIVKGTWLSTELLHGVGRAAGSGGWL